MILFALSAALLLLTAALLVRRLAADPGARFWVFLAAINLQLTTAHLATSLFHALTPAGFLIAQAAMLALAARSVGTPAPAGFPRPGLALLRWPGWRRPISAVLALAILAALGLSLAEQMLRPVTGFDERMYNCSRVLYWIQHGHIWPWPTHNDAQVDFPIGAEVFFSWPILFTRTEWIGRLVYWFGYPAAIVGVYTLSRTLRASRPGAAAAALAFAMTPTVLLWSGVSQKQDIWTAAMLLGVADWLVRCRRAASDHAPTRETAAPLLAPAMLGLYFVLAVNVKITCLAVVPMVGLAVLVHPRRPGAWRPLQRLVISGTAAAALSGLAATMGQNLQRYGHPLGPPAAAKVVAPTWSAQQVYTHAVRAPLQLLELPTYPGRIGQALRRWLVNAGNEIVYRLDAHRALPGEKRGAWPGWFRIDAGPPHDPRAYRFSLGGIAWLIAMTWAFAAVARRLVRWKRGGPLPDGAIVLILSAVQLAALVFLLRWVWGAPERYWVAPYAVGLSAACACLDRWAQRRTVAAALLAVLALTVYPSFESIGIRLRELRRQPITATTTDEPFTEVAARLPRGSTVLFFGNRNARDYPLFLPREGYPNRIVPWGRMKFDSERLERLILEQGITHAVFEYEDRLGFHWYPGIRVSWMVEWFRTRPYFREVPLDTPRQRMFERIGGR